MTETDEYQRTSMSPIGKQLIYNNDYRRYSPNRQEINNQNQRVNQLNEENYDERYNNRNRPNQMYNKRYNNDIYFDDKKIADYEYEQQNENKKSRNLINRRGYSQNPMSKSMNLYNNNYNRQNINEDGKRYENNNYYNGNRRYNFPNNNYYY